MHRFFQWRWLFFVNVCILVLLFASVGREWIRSRTIEMEISRLQEQADGLMTQNVEMAQLQTAMQSEAFIEREARLKLGLKKPGETVIVLQDDQSMTQETEMTDTDPADPLDYVIDPDEQHDSASRFANPTKWWFYFFEKNLFNSFYE